MKQIDIKIEENHSDIEQFPGQFRSSLKKKKTHIPIFHVQNKKTSDICFV